MAINKQFDASNIMRQLDPIIHTTTRYTLRLFCEERASQPIDRKKFTVELNDLLGDHKHNYSQKKSGQS